MHHPQPASAGSRESADMKSLSGLPASPAATQPTALSEEPCTRDPLGWDLDVLLRTHRPVTDARPARARDLNRPGRPRDMPADVAAISAALSLCHQCPVFAACRSEVLHHAEHGEAPRSLIWGGIVWGQRGEAWRQEDVPRYTRLAQHAIAQAQARHRDADQPGPGAESWRAAS